MKGRGGLPHPVQGCEMQIFVRSFIEQNTNMPVLKTRVSLKALHHPRHFYIVVFLPPPAPLPPPHGKRGFEQHIFTNSLLKYMNGNQDMIKTSSDDNLLLRDNSNCYSLIRKLSVRRRLKKLTAARKELACSRLRDGGEIRSVKKKNPKKERGLGRDRAPPPFSYFRFARFNTSPLYYLRAWNGLEKSKRGRLQ